MDVGYFFTHGITLRIFVHNVMQIIIKSYLVIEMCVYVKWAFIQHSQKHAEIVISLAYIALHHYKSGTTIFSTCHSY